ncbi:MAG: hypothetical protein ACYTFY_05770 [Planctomycetota bacterium]|jgi:hypothetical protein
MAISVNCPFCGAKFKAGIGYAGKKVSCKTCNAELIVPDSDGQEVPNSCPSCFKPMDSGAVVCVECGFDSRTMQAVGDSYSNEACETSSSMQSQALTAIGGFLVFVILIGYGIYSFVSTDKAERIESEKNRNKEQRQAKYDSQKKQSDLKKAKDTVETKCYAKYKITANSRLQNTIKNKLENSTIWSAYFSEPDADPIHFVVELKRTTYASGGYSFGGSYSPGKVSVKITVSSKSNPSKKTDTVDSQGLPSMVYVKGGQSAQQKAFAVAESNLLDKLSSTFDNAGANYYRSMGMFDSKILPLYIEQLKSGKPDNQITAASGIVKLKAYNPEIISALTVMLESPESKVRESALKTLTASKTKGKAAAPAIAQMIEKKQNLESAFKTLYTIKAYSPELISAALKSIKHEDKKTKTAALRWLKYSRSGIKENLAVLVKMLEDNDETIGRQIYSILSKNKSYISSIKSELTEIVTKSDNKTALTSAINLLKNSKVYTDETVKAAAKHLGNQERGLSGTAVSFLTNAASKVPEARVILINSLEDTPPNTQLSIVRNLGYSSSSSKASAITLPMLKLLDKSSDDRLIKQLESSIARLGPPVKDDLPEILKFADNDSPSVKYCVLKVIRKLSSKSSKEVKDTILKCINDDNSKVALEALYALKIIRKLSDDDIRALGLLILKDDEKITRQAMYIIKTQGKKNAIILKELRQYLKNNEHSNAAYDAIYAIGSMEKAAEPALDDIVEYLSHDKLKSSAVQAIGRIGIYPESVINKIIENLDDKRTSYNSSAQNALGKMGEEAALPVAELLASENVEHRRFAVYTLQRMRGNAAPAKSAVEKALEDEDSSVKRTAKNILRNIDRYSKK